MSRIRDEAHRFAVTFHKKLRRRRTLRSALEDVPGVGQKRQRELLKHFGAIKNVRVATVEELLQAPGMTRAAAEAVVRYFRGDGEPAPKVEADGEATTAEATSEATIDPQREDVAEDAAAQELAQLAPDDTVATTEDDTVTSDDDPIDEEE